MIHVSDPESGKRKNEKPCVNCCICAVYSKNEFKNQGITECWFFCRINWQKLYDNQNGASSKSKLKSIPCITIYSEVRKRIILG